MDSLLVVRTSLIPCAAANQNLLGSSRCKCVMREITEVLPSPVVGLC